MHQKSLLLVPPTHFRIEYSINPWMDLKNNPVNPNKALAQWLTLYYILRYKLKCNLVVANQEISCPDMVFTANAGLTLGNFFIMSNMRYPERKRESIFFEKYINKPIRYISHDLFFEGSGDAFYRNNILYGGHSYRTNKNSYKFFTQNYSDKIHNMVYIKLVDKRFYHLDTCFAPLRYAANTLVYVKAISHRSIKVIEKYTNIISVPEVEALKFACNAIIINDNVIIPKDCPETKKKLIRMGNNVYDVDMSEFMKAGGGPKCLVLEL